MKILAIETSCDETAVCVIDADGGLENAQFTILGNALYSQVAVHAPYGGVYPALAKREHQENLAPLATESLKEADLLKPAEPNTTSHYVNRDKKFEESINQFLSTYAKPDIDVIAVTKGPGLELALWTGISFAEALGAAWNIPVIGIDHLEGHIVSALLTPQIDAEKSKPKRYALNVQHFPILALLISGGHTQFTLMKNFFDYEHIGATKDDAIGEAFDKVARLLELSYPGGPEIAKVADRARERGNESGIEFPRPMAHDNTCDFSFSGLKTAVLYKLRTMEKISETDKEEIAQAFEDAARDIVVIKTNRALKATAPRTFAVGGGVSANTEIRNALTKLIHDDFPDITLAFPDKSLTGDNAIMIGIAGYLRQVAGKTVSGPLSAHGSQKLA